MKILVDICHPAHVHFFRHPIRMWREQGHEVLVTSRRKEFATELLDELHLPHRILSSEGKGGLFALGKELLIRNRALLNTAREFRPDVMTAIGGIFVAQVGWFAGIPSVVFYDTENARLQNLLTYPFASLVVVPNAYSAHLPRNHLRYPGYHELSYLHPDVFHPDREIAIRNGLAAEGDTFFIRMVAWRANHDIAEKGWTTATLRAVVHWLSQRGKVLISSEAPLPRDLLTMAYQGNPKEVHHVLAYTRLFIGESATMASECVVLGVPAIYAAHTGRGYTTEQEQRYSMLHNLHDFDAERIISTIEEILSTPHSIYKKRHQRLLAETMPVANLVARLVLEQAQLASIH